MKTINVTFEEEEYEILLKRKGKEGWHDYILQPRKEWWEGKPPSRKEVDREMKRLMKVKGKLRDVPS